MSLQRSQLIWEECVKDELCIKVFGQNECVEVSACVRIIFESANYYVEVETFGERWKWNLTKACYDFLEYGIVRLRLCVSPDGKNGAKIVLEACLGVASVSKCWTLLAEDVAWSFDEIASAGDLKKIEESAISTFSTKPSDRASLLVSASSTLSPSEIEETTRSESVTE